MTYTVEHKLLMNMVQQNACFSEKINPDTTILLSNMCAVIHSMTKYILYSCGGNNEELSQTVKLLLVLLYTKICVRGWPISFASVPTIQHFQSSLISSS